jgi:hypothetical protein
VDILEVAHKKKKKLCLLFSTCVLSARGGGVGSPTASATQSAIDINNIVDNVIHRKWDRADMYISKMVRKDLNRYHFLRDHKSMGSSDCL